MRRYRHQGRGRLALTLKLPRALRLAGREALVRDCYVFQARLRSRVARVHRFQGGGYGAGDDEVAVPLLVGGDDMLGGVLRRTLVYGIFEGVLVVIPEGTLFESLVENFQRFSGSSSRLWRRRFCSSLEMCRRT